MRICTYANDEKLNVHPLATQWPFGTDEDDVQECDAKLAYVEQKKGTTLGAVRKHTQSNKLARLYNSSNWALGKYGDTWPGGEHLTTLQFDYEFD